MAKFKPCNYNQMVMLPISLENQLMPGSLEQTINELVEKHIELAVFDERCNNDDTGASVIHPKVLLKIILFAYSRGLISSRQMERACGYTPDYSTIAAFVSSMQKKVESVFCNILLVCNQLGLLGKSHFSLDEVKMSANVSKERYSPATPITSPIVIGCTIPDPQDCAACSVRDRYLSKSTASRSPAG